MQSLLGRGDGTAVLVQLNKVLYRGNAEEGRKSEGRDTHGTERQPSTRVQGLPPLGNIPRGLAYIMADIGTFAFKALE